MQSSLLGPSEWWECSGSLCSPHGWARRAELSPKQLPHHWKQVALGISHLHLILQTYVAKCTWPWWALCVHLYGLPGVSSLWFPWAKCHWNSSHWDRGLNDNKNMVWFSLVWFEERRDVSLSPCISVQLAFMHCMVPYKHHKALTSVVPSALQHSVTNWKLSLHNSDLYYCVNGAPAFRNSNSQFSFQ